MSVGFRKSCAPLNKLASVRIVILSTALINQCRLAQVKSSFIKTELN